MWKLIFFLRQEISLQIKRDISLQIFAITEQHFENEGESNDEMYNINFLCRCWNGDEKYKCSFSLSSEFYLFLVEKAQASNCQLKWWADIVSCNNVWLLKCN